MDGDKWDRISALLTWTWSAVYFSAPLSLGAVAALPHLCIDERKRRLNLTQAILGRNIPSGVEVALGMNSWTTALAP